MMAARRKTLLKRRKLFLLICETILGDKTFALALTFICLLYEFGRTLLRHILFPRSHSEHPVTHHHSSWLGTKGKFG